MTTSYHADRGAEFAPILPALHTTKGQVHRLHFRNAEAIARAIPDTLPTAWNRYRAAWDCKPGPSPWAGTTTMAAAKELCLAGWHDGARQAEEIARRLSLSIPQRPRLARHSIAGAVPNVPRFLAGDPLHMRALRMDDSSRRPVVTLLADASMSAMIDASHALLTASVQAAIVDAIEAAGFQVELFGCYRGTHTGFTPGVIDVCWRIKEAGASLDLPRLAFAAGHPAMVRRLVFALLAWDAEAYAVAGEMMCIPWNVLALDVDRPPGCYVIPGPKALPPGEARAFGFAVDALRKQGCPGFETAQIAA